MLVKSVIGLAVLSAVAAMPFGLAAFNSASATACMCCGDDCTCSDCGCDANQCSCSDGGSCACSSDCSSACCEKGSETSAESSCCAKGECDSE